MPPNTARCHIHVGVGRAKYEPEQRAIVWRIKRMIGGAEAVFSADVELTPSIRGKAWSRPPIQVGGEEGSQGRHRRVRCLLHGTRRKGVGICVCFPSRERLTLV